jgi:hypothetical protein
LECDHLAAPETGVNATAHTARSVDGIAAINASASSGTANRSRVPSTHNAGTHRGDQRLAGVPHGLTASADDKLAGFECLFCVPFRSAMMYV